MWIARDNDGSLWLYAEKPKKHKDTGMFETNEKKTWMLNGHLFPEVTFSNSPKEVALVLLGK